MSERFTVARGHPGQAIPEIQLLLNCASAAPGFGPRSGLETLFGQSLDWDALVERAGRHGVLPLVHRALKDCPRVPPRVLEGLDRHFRTNAWNSLRLAWHLADLSDLFRSHGIAAAAFKGPALALAAYGDVTLRQISDLDVLVKRSQVAEVVRLLPLHGYTYQQSLPDRSQAAERRVFYNHVFTRERVQVDVHWAFSENFFPFEIDQARLWRRLSHVRILEKSVETLDVEDTILVLCVHGARHCWGRLA